MKSSSLSLRASFGLALLSLSAGCTGSERFPPVEVGATRPNGDVLVGRVQRRGGAEPIGRVDEAVAYAPSADIDAGARMADAAPMAGEDVAYEQAAAPVSSASMEIPQYGVNMDAGLGLGPAQTAERAAEANGLGVQPQIVTNTGAMAMAEGATAQPVVDGIGFDEPVQVAAGAPDSGEDAGLDQSADVSLGEGEGQILPLSVDSGNSGMETRPVARRKPQADCSLYLDKRNCPRG